MKRTFSENDLAHIYQCAIDGDDIDADTVCILIDDILLALGKRTVEKQDIVYIEDL